MIVLGFDTATRATAVALRLDDGRMLHLRDDPPVGEHPGHATRLLAMAGELLVQAGVGWRQVDRVAAGVGPGTFTGLRVGVATARGLAQSLSLELVGVSSTAALAQAALNARPGETDAPAEGGVLAVIDARRGEVFAAAYVRDEQGSPRELVAPRALAPQDARSVVALAEEHGAEPSLPWLAVGDGAIRYRAHLSGPEVAVPEDSSGLHLVDGRAICELGVRARPAAAYEEILPDYRRRPDAEIALEATAAAGAPAR